MDIIEVPHIKTDSNQTHQYSSLHRQVKNKIPKNRDIHMYTHVLRRPLKSNGQNRTEMEETYGKYWQREKQTREIIKAMYNENTSIENINNKESKLVY